MSRSRIPTNVLTLTIFSALLLSGCSGGAVTTPTSSPTAAGVSGTVAAEGSLNATDGSLASRGPTRWVSVANVPAGTYNFGWGTSASDVYFGGPPLGGVTSNVSGSWLAVDIGTRAAFTGDKPGIFRLFGFGPRDIYAVGGVFLPNTGVVQRFDGQSWAAMTPAPLPANWFGDIWGPHRRNLYLVGESGTIEHFDGTAWTYMTSGTPNRLLALWGQDQECLFAAGYAGTIVQLQHGTWHTMTVPTPNTGNLNQITMMWGSSCSDVWAAPRDAAPGSLLHYDGRRWLLVSTGTTSLFDGIYGTSSDNIVAVGTGGTIVHFDGHAWQQMDSGTTNDLLGIWAASPSRFFVSANSGGGGILESR